MKKYLPLLWFLGVCFILGARAIPSKKIPFTVVQPDSTTVMLTLIGDEHFHYYATEDGIPVFCSEDGRAEYAKFEVGGLQPTGRLAHDVWQRTADEQLFLAAYVADTKREMQAFHARKIQMANEYRSRRLARNRRNVLGKPTVYKGQKKGLVILVNFTDLVFRASNTQQVFKDMFNKAGYTGNNHIGSVHDYFLDQSYGQFDLSFDVVGPVAVSRNYSYYGKNSILKGDDYNVRVMITEACRLADASVNFKDYDWDGDGEVDQVYVIYAGYGEHAGAGENYIWPHESHLSSSAITLDGVKINTYACSCELTDTHTKALNGIGTACHEFSHCLGLPDLYDTSANGNSSKEAAYGMGCWDLMASGSFNGPNGDGEVPCGYTAYERWFSGWLDYTEINTTFHVEEMPELGDTAMAYTIYNEGNRNEYYILENRQAKRWFSYLRGTKASHGMLVTHVDYNETAWGNNTINTNLQHMRMSVIPADGNYAEDSYLDIQGDLFPGPLGVTSLTNTSHTDVGGRLFNRNTDGTYNMNMDILNIRETADGFLSFDVISKNLNAPTAYEAADLTITSFTALWSVVENADYYTVELYDYSLPDRLARRIVSPVYSTFYTFTDLKGKNYSYRVRAVQNGVSSDWSSSVSVVLPEDALPEAITLENITYRIAAYLEGNNNATLKSKL